MSQVSVVKWLHSSSGRSKRPETVNAGCFVLTHEATGRYYVESTKQVSETVDKRLGELSLGKHPCKLLNGLYSKDSDIRVHEYPVKSDAKCKALEKELIHGSLTDYLCLNIPVKKKRKSKK